MWGKIYAERKRQVLDNVALDDGSENLVLLTNVMFSELVLYGIKELTTTHSVIEVIRSKHTLWMRGWVSAWWNYLYNNTNRNERHKLVKTSKRNCNVSIYMCVCLFVCVKWGINACAFCYSLRWESHRSELRDRFS